jgi:two-component system, OmpR family, aerobic respiration control sensor histidine kinase ArcB
MEIAKNEISIFGKAYTLLNRSLIVINPKMVIEHINEYAEQLLDLEHKHTITGQHFHQARAVLTVLPFINHDGEISYSAPVMIKNCFRKWQVIPVFINKNQWLFVVDEDVSENEKIYTALKNEVERIAGHSFTRRLSVDDYVNEIHNYLTSIINKIPCYVYWKNKRLEYIGCNEMAASFFNLKSPEEIFGKTDFDLFSDPELAESYRTVDRKIFTDGQAVLNLPQELLDSKGRIFHTLVSKVPITNKAGEIIGVLGITVDVTKEKQSEMAKSDFISNMEHDLKTPFCGIGGIANFLYDMETDETKKELLSLMVKSCTQWEQVHHRIFDALVVEQSQELRIETVSIANELAEIKDMMAATVYMKKIAFEVASVPDELNNIKTDRVKFRLILSSLISNAINFTEEGAVTVITSPEGDGFKIQVTDTGIGIPADKLDYVFERFAKLSRSNKYGVDFKGLGLGLYVCREYAKQLGATIRVESKLGEGSIFTVQFSGQNTRCDYI